MNELKVNIVTMDEILELHDAWIEILGGQSGIFNPSVLMYAYEAQMSPYYETIFQKVANFGGRITKEHAFNDGNKRTGYSCCWLFLRRNGYILLPSFEEAYEVFKRLSLGTGVPGEMTYEELAEWLEANSVPIDELL